MTDNAEERHVTNHLSDGIKPPLAGYLPSHANNKKPLLPFYRNHPFKVKFKIRFNRLSIRRDNPDAGDNKPDFGSVGFKPVED